MMQDEKTKMDRLVPTRTVPGARLDRWPASGLGEPIVTLREFERAIRSWASASADGRARLETDLRTHCCASRRPIIAAPPTGSLVDWSRAAPTVALRGGGGARCALLVM